MDPSWLNNMLLAAALTAALYGSWRWLGNAAAAGSADPRLTRDVVHQALLLDVRSRAEFAANRLPGARNIPLGELGPRMHEVGKKKRPVLVYCMSGARSRSAARQLEDSGFSTVIDLGSQGSARMALQDVRRQPNAAASAAPGQ